MGKYNNGNIDKMIELTKKKEAESLAQREKFEYKSADWCFHDGKAEAFHEIAHDLINIKER